MSREGNSLFIESSNGNPPGVMTGRTLHKTIGAVCCIFNPFRLESRIRNYLLFREGIEKAGIRLLTVELAFADTPFQIDDGPNVVHVRGGDIMWQKERLLQIGGERLLAEEYSGLVFLDADLIFHDDGWPLRVVDALDRHPVVQCFSAAVKTYTDEVVDAASAVSAWQRESRLRGSAKGLAWAMRSDLFACTGLYQHCVVGGGDSALCLAALGLAHGSDAWTETLSSETFMRPAGPIMLAHYQAWACRFFEAAGETAGHVAGTVETLVHGSRERRRYGDRHEILAGFEPEREVAAAAVGAFVWTESGEARRKPVRRYLFDRLEDAE